MKIKGMKNKKILNGCWVLVSCYWLLVAGWDYLVLNLIQEEQATSNK